MRISKVRFSNGYKRFHDLTIDLGSTPGRIIALVGPNGSGKSSVLDGFMFHQSAHQRVGSHIHIDHGYHSMNPNKPATHTDIEIEFSGGQPFHAMRATRERLGKGNTVFSFRSPYRYNSHVKIHEIRSTSPIRENDYGAATAATLDSKMEENYRRLQAQINRYMEENDVKPSEARSKIIGELNESITRCLNLEILHTGNVEAGEGTLYFKKVDHKHRIEFNVLSSGEKEVVDLLLDLYLRRDDYDDSVFLIDEPELHVNTAIQGRLLAEIDHLIGESCQIWLTTHSIGLLRALQTLPAGRCQIIQFKEDFALASSAYTLTPMKTSAAAWRELFAVALDDLASLVSPKTIVYCEGRGEPGDGGRERGMDAQALNAIFAASHPDTLFISSGGSTELDQRSTVAIAILSKVFPNVDVLVFKDRDMVSGRTATEHDRQVYLQNNPTHHRVMKRFELENYLFDKEVLQAYCRAHSLSFDEVAYDKLVTDITNQNLKDMVGRIKNICGIAVSISSDTFKISLADHFAEHMIAFSELNECIFERA